MSESRINRDNYITISGWMVTELNLKGNELIIYAMIYGFSQAENQIFDGSINYLCEWLQASRPTVINTLKSLVEKGLIVKNEKAVNNIKYVEYRAVKKAPAPLPAPEVNKSHNNFYHAVIDYLNTKTGRNFSAANQETRKHINARIAEGRTLADFMRVIDIKTAEWLGNPKMEQFLRPSTLFSPKFESYLNQTPAAPAPKRAEQKAPESDNPAKTFNIDEF